MPGRRSVGAAGTGRQARLGTDDGAQPTTTAVGVTVVSERGGQAGVDHGRGGVEVPPHDVRDELLLPLGAAASGGSGVEDGPVVGRGVVEHAEVGGHVGEATGVVVAAEGGEVTAGLVQGWADPRRRLDVLQKRKKNKLMVL